MTRVELLKTAKPILFNTDMVRAIQSGAKTVTRRVINPRYRADEFGFRVVSNAHTGEFARVEKIDENECGIFADGTERYVKPPFCPGDILYVRETWNADWCDRIIYKSDGGSAKSAGYSAEPRWHPSIHMPKKAARLFLQVTDVRAERLQDINETAMECEGINTRITHFKRQINNFGNAERFQMAQKEFSGLWNSDIKPADLAHYGWDANPWVWVIKFERIAED